MSEIIIFSTPDHESHVEVKLEHESVWLSLNDMTELFGRDKSVISRHIKKIYQEGELDETATVAKNATVQTEAGRGVKRTIEYFNLDLIISVGYRVNSKRGTQFRIWATKILREHLVKGYTLKANQMKRI
jgi:hypothetical protein